MDRKPSIIESESAEHTDRFAIAAFGNPTKLAQFQIVNHWSIAVNSSDPTGLQTHRHSMVLVNI